MSERRISFDAGMMFGVGSEHVGSFYQLLETEILEHSLGQEQVQLSVEASAQVELHQHVTTALAITAL